VVKFFALLPLLCLPANCLAQLESRTALAVQPAANLPATCSLGRGDVRTLTTGAKKGLWICTGAGSPCSGAACWTYFGDTVGTVGITSLNALTAGVQTFAVGTAGTDFAISSATSTHTFNLPTASATVRGALSSANWSTFNAKIGGAGTSGKIPKFTAAGTIGDSAIMETTDTVSIPLVLLLGPSNSYTGAGGDGTTLIGSGNNSSTNGPNFLLGTNNLAGSLVGGGNTLIGSGNTTTSAANNSMAIGQNVTISGDNTIALGAGTVGGTEASSNVFSLFGGTQKYYGATSGVVTIAWPATITTYTLVPPSAQGGVDTYLKNDGSGNLSWAAASGGGTAPIIQPSSKVPVTSGMVFENTHISAGSGWKYFAGYGVANATDLTSDAIWAFVYPMPPALPTGTAKLRTRCIANATSNAMKFNVKWASCAVEEDCSGLTLQAEGTSTITWAAGDNDQFKELDVTLDADTPAAGENIVMNWTAEDSGYTLAVTATCSMYVVFIP
jgi:hypothetical protein